jgi:hypothetical protein
MSALREQMVSRFPEVADRLYPEDGEYTLAGEVVRWLQGLPRSAFTAEMVSRLRSFKEWCETQPRTDSAEDDVYTVFIVGFWEHLFEADSTRYLIPRLAAREEVIAAREYLISWVGAENYQIALDEYERTV